MIGVFDSGIGGLTALAELRALRPDLDIVYFADTENAPIGGKSPDTVTRIARNALSFLLSEGADSVLIACGTVSSVSLHRLMGISPVPLFGVIEPAARAAVRKTVTGRVGVLATAATVKSGAYEKALQAVSGTAVLSVACPLFVSLAENGFTSPADPVALAAAEHYLAPLASFGADTVILGCTHFSLLAGAIARVLPNARLIGSGEAAADALCETLPRVGHGELSVYVSDSPAAFAERAKAIFGTPLPCPVRLRPKRRL